MIPIYYINLDRSTDRNSYINKQLTSFPTKRIQAIDYQDHPEKIPTLYTDSKHTELKYLACLASHLKAIQTAYYDNLEEVLISEDDIDFTIFKKTYPQIANLWKDHRDELELLQLHSSSKDSIEKLYRTLLDTRKIKLIQKNIHNMTYWGATLYLINRKGMKKVMDLYRPEENDFDITGFKKYKTLSDVLLYLICDSKVLNVPCINISKPTILDSTIQTDDHIAQLQMPGYNFIQEHRDTFIDILQKYQKDQIIIEKSNREISNQLETPNEKSTIQLFQKLYQEINQLTKDFKEKEVIALYNTHKKTILDFTPKEDTEADLYVDLVVFIRTNLNSKRLYNDSWDLLLKVYENIPEKCTVAKHTIILNILSTTLSNYYKLDQFIPWFKKMDVNSLMTKGGHLMNKLKFYLYTHFIKTNDYAAIPGDHSILYHTLYDHLKIHDNTEFSLERFVLNWSNEMIYNYTCREVNAYYNLKDKIDLGNYTLKPKDNYIDIVFLSSDFFNRPTGQLINSFFDYPVTSKIRFHLVQVGYYKNDHIFQNLKQKAQSFHHSDSFHQTVVLVKSIHPDVIIDLMGLMFNNVLNVMSLKLAPVQIAWLTYPSTLGLEAIDYMVVDKDVVKPGSERFYTEKMMYLPDSYQINDDRLAYAEYSKLQLQDKAYQKKDPSLVYFGYFNQHYKIDTRSLDLWHRALSRCPKGRLVLLDPINKIVKNNILDYWIKIGGSLDQLILWRMLEKNKYLERNKRYIDFCVDTSYCNGHTTSSDILSAGVPLVVLPHETFAGSVSSGLLKTIKCEELIAKTPDDYVEKIVRLIEEPEYLTQMRKRFHYHIRKYNLFNSKRYFDHFISGIEMAYQNYHRGKVKDHIRVPALPEYETFPIKYGGNSKLDLVITSSHSTMKLLIGDDFELLINGPCEEIWYNGEVLRENLTGSFPDGTEEKPYRITFRKYKKRNKVYLIVNDKIVSKLNPLSFSKLRCNGKVRINR